MHLDLHSTKLDITVFFLPDCIGKVNVEKTFLKLYEKQTVIKEKVVMSFNSAYATFFQNETSLFLLLHLRSLIRK